jgi:ribosomal peptide maturation radical SAM protein 1
MPKMLLVAPPWRILGLSSLALGTLGPILRQAGIEVDELHGSILFPKVANPLHVLETYGRYLFVPALNGTPVEPLLDDILRDVIDEANLQGILMPWAEVTPSKLGLDEKHLKKAFRKDIASAQICLDRALERMLAAPYDIIGFSTTFDDQVPAALAMARRLKKVRPEVKVIFGGAACFEEQADGLVASFPEIDVACYTEGESVIVPLVKALRGEGELPSVPGIVYREPGTGTLRHTPSPPLLENLDALPIPDYSRFIAQYEASERWIELHVPPRLMFETSRGCWWGQKSLCTFCGLNAEGLGFRSKSPERAYEEMTTLWRTYPTVVHLQAADNIVDMKYLTTLFPRLAELPKEPERPFRCFYEVKSNMKPEQVEVMAAAGVDRVQPGIESFSDDVLKHMRKGCTALGQIQFLKWAQQSKILPMYNIIMRNPGDRVEWYREMIELLPFLTHLPPPVGIVTMHLERFSPYFMSPDEFGITNVRPRPYYKLLYPDEGVDLGRIAYQFDFDHPSHTDAALTEAYRLCAERLGQWRDAWKDEQLLFGDEGDRLIVLDRRHGGNVKRTIAGVAAELFLYLDAHRSREQIAKTFPTLAPELVDTLLLTWIHRRWVCTDGGRYLAVVPRKGPLVARRKLATSRSRTLPLVQSDASTV